MHIEKVKDQRDQVSNMILFKPTCRWCIPRKHIQQCCHSKITGAQLLDFYRFHTPNDAVKKIQWKKIFKTCTKLLPKIRNFVWLSHLIIITLRSKILHLMSTLERGLYNHRQWHLSWFHFHQCKSIGQILHLRSSSFFCSEALSSHGAVQQI